MAKKTNPLALLREAWLNRATALFTAHWVTLGVTVPVDVQLSCGFPGGCSVRRRIGECWPRSRSVKKVNQIFISPVIDAPLVALDILGHELLHAVDDCASMHGTVFTKNSGRVGYSGGKHSTAETPAAKARLSLMLKTLGRYPHGVVTMPKKKVKSNTGLRKFYCPEHNDVLYSTEKMVDESDAQKGQLEDPPSDEVGRLLTAMNAIPTWTLEKKRIKELLLRQLEKEKYDFFWGSYRPFLLANIGDSTLCKVPENKMGRLKQFRGKTIRLIRIGSSNLNVYFAAQAMQTNTAPI